MSCPHGSSNDDGCVVLGCADHRDSKMSLDDFIEMTEEDLRMVLEMAVLIGGGWVTSAVAKQFFYKSRKNETVGEFMSRMNFLNKESEKSFLYTVDLVLSVLLEAGKAPPRNDD